MPVWLECTLCNKNNFKNSGKYKEHVRGRAQLLRARLDDVKKGVAIYSADAFENWFDGSEPPAMDVEGDEGDDMEYGDIQNEDPRSDQESYVDEMLGDMESEGDDDDKGVLLRQTVDDHNGKGSSPQGSS